MHPGVYIVLAVLVLIIIWGIYYQKKLDKSRYDTIKNFADKYGLDYDIHELKSGVAKLSGDLQGINFKYWEERMPLTNSDAPSYWTVLQFKNSPFEVNLKISQEVGIMKFAKALGFSDILFEDKELDAAFYFQSSHPEQLKSIFNVQKQEVLLSIKDDLCGIIENNPKENTFTYYYFGRIQQSFHMPPVQRVLDFMLVAQK